jgi:hypothetical protein
MPLIVPECDAANPVESRFSESRVLQPNAVEPVFWC